MPATFRRFEYLLRLLTTLVLTLSALGLLLIPGRMGSLTSDVPVILLFLIGISIYIVGLVNQASIFIVQTDITQQIIDIVVTACLGLLVYLYFQAHLVIECISLVILICAQLYLLTVRTYDDETERKIFILGLTGLSLSSSFLLLLGLFDTLAYEGLESLNIYLGIIFLIGGLAGLASFYLSPKKIAETLFKLIAVPWIIWVLVLSLTSQFNSVVITFGFAVIPLLTDLGFWNKLRLPPNDLIGRKVIRIASVAEFLMMVSLVFIAFNSQGLFFQNGIVTGNSFLRFNQDFSFGVMLVAKGFTLYGLMIVVLSINRLRAEWTNPDFDEKEYTKSPFNNWSRWISSSFRSLASPSRNLQTKVEIQSEQISSLIQQLQNEKKRSAQLNLLAELSHQLEAQLDQPVAAQLAINTLQRALDCKHVAVYENEIERREFSIMASGGTYLPPGYRQSTSQGILGRTLRLRKTQIANDAQLDPDLVNLDTTQIQSIFAVPLIYHGHVKAILEVGDDKTNAFGSQDVHLAELIATELIRAWERSSYHQRLTNLIKAGISLSPLLESQTTIKEIATIARETLEARFTFVTLLDQEGNFSRTAYSGNAPRLMNSLNQNPVTSNDNKSRSCAGLSNARNKNSAYTHVPSPLGCGTVYSPLLFFPK